MCCRTRASAFSPLRDAVHCVVITVAVRNIDLTATEFIYHCASWKKHRRGEILKKSMVSFNAIKKNTTLGAFVIAEEDEEEVV